MNLKFRANSPCPLGALIFLKADLAEFGSTLGFWKTASNVYPCFFCDCRRQRMIELDRWDSATHPFNLRSWEEYQAACAICEQWRYISREQHTALRGLLSYDRLKQSRGVALREDFAALDLLKDDRLEPWSGCQDIKQFEQLSSFPTQVLFWRRSRERMTHHRNPLFDPSY